jgi:hypothetical protein
MAFNASFNHISAVLRRSLLLVEETEEPGENYRPCSYLGCDRCRLKAAVFINIS